MGIPTTPSELVTEAATLELFATSEELEKDENCWFNLTFFEDEDKVPSESDLQRIDDANGFLLSTFCRVEEFKPDFWKRLLASIFCLDGDNIINFCHAKSA